MNVLDENIVAPECAKLRKWSIPYRQIGDDVGRGGALDEDVIPLLHQLAQPTFFTHDDDYFKRSLCHENYCLVFLDVDDNHAADFIRRFLKYPDFRTQASRAGLVARVDQTGVSFWRKGMAALEFRAW
jgi:hypothetical protein